VVQAERDHQMEHQQNHLLVETDLQAGELLLLKFHHHLIILTGEVILHLPETGVVEGIAAAVEEVVDLVAAVEEAAAAAEEEDKLKYL